MSGVDPTPNFEVRIERFESDPDEEQDNKRTIRFENKDDEEDDIDNDKYLAEKTGLLWIYDGASPTDDKINKESFMTQAQQTTSNTEDVNEIEHSMSNLSIDQNPTRQCHLSSNSLRVYQSQNECNFNVPNFQHYSSQNLDYSSLHDPQYQQWPVTSIPEFQHIA